MNILKQIFTYCFWTAISFLAGFGYMRIILGPKPEPSTGIMRMFDWVYEYAMVRVGSIIGGIIALLFILLDVFYLKKKLLNNKYSILIRLLTVVAITIVVGATHYIMEKVIDII